MTIVQQKDTTYTKLFVGGLPYHTTDATLSEFFRQFGDIDEAVVITDRQTGKSRGYGFVTMSERSAAERICKDPNPIIDGRKANVNLAYLGAKPRLQATDLLAALPYTLKAVNAAGLALQTSSLPAAQFTGLPQYIYPPTGTYLSTPPSAAAFAYQFGSSPAAVQPQFIDYAALSTAGYGPHTLLGFQGLPAGMTLPPAAGGYDAAYPATYGYLTTVATPGGLQEVTQASPPPPPQSSFQQQHLARPVPYGTVIYQQ